ncbi:phosphotransferase enzyme family protein [Burkholderia thailandensis]|nr:phosphotransferase enzyme family protein [Burkholderia thailandensis]
MSQDGSSGNLTERLRERTTGLRCRLPRFFGLRIADDNPKQLKGKRNI